MTSNGEEDGVVCYSLKQFIIDWIGDLYKLTKEQALTLTSTGSVTMPKRDDIEKGYLQACGLNQTLMTITHSEDSTTLTMPILAESQDRIKQLLFESVQRGRAYQSERAIRSRFLPLDNYSVTEAAPINPLEHTGMVGEYYHYSSSQREITACVENEEGEFIEVGLNEMLETCKKWRSLDEEKNETNKK
jgi:hypothetical protein